MEAIETLDLDGEARMAGASTGVAYPLALRSVARALAVGHGDRVADLGAGLGGASRWLATTTHASVVAVETSVPSARGARRLFPGLPIMVGAIEAIPLTGSSCDAVTLLGVISLVGDLDPVLNEVVRVLRPGGRLGLTDLCLTSGRIARPTGSPNTFRSLSAIAAAVASRDLRVRQLEATDADIDAGWDDVGKGVDDEIERRHGDEPACDAWREDRHRLGSAIAAGDLQVASLVAVLDTA